MDNLPLKREFEWKLTNFTRESLEVLEDGLYSREIMLYIYGGESYWQLKANSDGTYIGFYITTNDLDLDMCSVKIYPWIPNKNNIITYQGDQKQVLDYRRNGIICGYEYYLKIDDIFNNPNEFLVNDTLTLRMNAEFLDEPTTGNKKMHCKYMPDPKLQDLKQKLKELYGTKMLIDFTFICSDGQQVPAHSCLLAANSKVMNAMLSHEMLETKNRTVELDDIDGETMTEILRYMYIREAHNIEALAFKLIYGADKYELEGLMNLCAEEMLKFLSFDNAIDYLIIADRHNLKELFDRCVTFINYNYEKFRDHQDWFKLDHVLLNKLMDDLRNKRVQKLRTNTQSILQSRNRKGKKNQKIKF